MSPDDSRHGSTRGYHAGCRNACCKAARARYEKEGRLARLRGGRAIPAIGGQRRIRALMRLGWTSTDIAQAAGWANRNDVLRIVNGQRGKPTRWLERATDEAVRSVYDKLSMRTPPASPYRERTRALALRRGWVGPLAWDDDAIDNPQARPVGVGPVRRPTKDDVDEVAVRRAMHGERIQLTKAERTEVCLRLRDQRWSDKRIEEHTGLNVSRYAPKQSEVAA